MIMKLTPECWIHQQFMTGKFDKLFDHKDRCYKTNIFAKKTFVTIILTMRAKHNYCKLVESECSLFCVTTNVNFVGHI